MGKYFTNDDLKNIEISEDAIISIAALTAAEVDGVVSSGNKPSALDFKELISKKGFGKNVSVSEEDGKLAIDINITVEYGRPIAEVSRNVQKAVFSAVSDSIGLELAAVNVTVGSIYFPKPEN